MGRIIDVLFVLIFSFSFSQSVNVPEFLLKNLQFDNITSKCSEQLSKLKVNLIIPVEDSWAAKIIDSCSKIHSGILSLNIDDFGNFEQCINTKAITRNDEVIMGKYCLGYLSLDYVEMVGYMKYLDKRIQEQVLIQKKLSTITNSATDNSSVIRGPTWGACFPDGCTTKDINHITNTIVQKFGTNRKIIFTDFYCQTQKDLYSKYTAGAIITLVLFWCYFVYLCICTFYDYSYKYFGKVSGPDSLISAFSFYSNTKKLFKINKDRNHIPCLDGLRVLSMLWVVIGHQYAIINAEPIKNMQNLINWANSLRSMFVINSTMATETFLTTGAFLLTINFLRTKSNHTAFSYPKYCLHRYIRLTPPLLAMVLINSTLINYMGSGPRWPAIQPHLQKNCVKYWWSTLLYLQNYINVENMCVGQSWYLSIDMQLYLLAPILLIYLYKKPKIGLYCIYFCIGFVIIMSFFISWANELSAILSSQYGNLEHYNHKYYLLTHMRAAPWLIGVVLGYYVFQYQAGEQTYSIGKFHSILLWVLCVLILFFCVLIGHDSLRGEKYTTLGNALYIATIRPLWSLGICWIIFACVVDSGKISEIMKSFFSSNCFQILSRFNYSVYLIHVPLIDLVSLSRKNPVYFSDFEMIRQFWGSLSLSFILAYFWIMAFELPFINIENIFYQKNWRLLSPLLPSSPASTGRTHGSSEPTSLATSPMSLESNPARSLDSPLEQIENDEEAIAMTPLNSGSNEESTSKTERETCTADIHV